MRMRGAAEFGGRRLQAFSQHHLGNQVGRVMPDDLASDDLAVFLRDDELDESLRLSGCNRLAVGPERELADLHVDSARPRIRLAQPYRGHLGLAVDASRDREEIEPRLAYSRHNLDGRHALRRRLVGEQGRADDVADRIDARAGRAKRIIDLDETSALQLDARLLTPEPV